MDRGFFPKESTGLDSGTRRMGKLGFLNNLATATLSSEL